MGVGSFGVMSRRATPAANWAERVGTTRGRASQRRRRITLSIAVVVLSTERYNGDRSKILMSQKTPQFSNAAMSAGMAWLLLLYPQSLHLYALAASGQLARPLHLFLTGGAVSSAEATQLCLSGMLVGPLGASVAFITLYCEALGRGSTKMRRIVFCVAG